MYQVLYEQSKAQSRGLAAQLGDSEQETAALRRRLAKCASRQQHADALHSAASALTLLRDSLLSEIDSTIQDLGPKSGGGGGGAGSLITHTLNDAGKRIRSVPLPSTGRDCLPAMDAAVSRYKTRAEDAEILSEKLKSLAKRYRRELKKTKNSAERLRRQNERLEEKLASGNTFVHPESSTTLHNSRTSDSPRKPKKTESDCNSSDTSSSPSSDPEPKPLPSCISQRRKPSQTDTPSHTSRSPHEGHPHRRGHILREESHNGKAADHRDHNDRLWEDGKRTAQHHASRRLQDDEEKERRSWQDLSRNDRIHHEGDHRGATSQEKQRYWGGERSHPHSQRSTSHSNSRTEIRGNEGYPYEKEHGERHSQKSRLEDEEDTVRRNTTFPRGVADERENYKSSHRSRSTPQTEDELNGRREQITSGFRFDPHESTFDDTESTSMWGDWQRGRMGDRVEQEEQQEEEEEEERVVDRRLGGTGSIKADLKQV